MNKVLTTLIALTSFVSVSAQTKLSVLKEGEVYKFAVKETGVYRLDYAFLKNELKIANIDQLDPRTFKLYGNGGGRLPESNAAQRADDLTENAVLIEGEADGKFDAGDALIFYAVGADKAQFNPANHTFSRPKNIYADQTFYFLKISTGNGLRVVAQPSLANTTYTSTTYNDFARYEEDKLNVLASASCNCTQGGGKDWFGDFIGSGISEKTYTDKFSFPNLTTDSILVRGRFAGASFNTAPFAITLGTQALSTDVYPIGSTGPDDTQAQAASISERIASPFKTGESFSLKVSYGGQKGWLDYVELNLRQNLKFNGTPFSFRDVRTLSKSATNFQIANINANTLIWDITKPQVAKNQQFTNASNTANFGTNTEGVLREFVVFDKTGVLLKPSAVVGKIANQNLHGIETTDLLIVYPKEFEAATKKLAEHRRQKSGLTVEIAEIGQVYNEFSSGALDPAAIRDFARVLHRRSAKFRYLLLMGDGSFDYKRVYPLGNLQATDFIPPYETDDSFDAINAFPSDDFYALLDDAEGVNLVGDLDIAVGRIPCKTASEANGVVGKIIRYDSPSALGDWRNRSVFMADDSDGNLHFSDTDDIANRVGGRTKNLNLDKLYVDAYKLDVSSGGTRVPQLNETLFQNQFKGMLTLCYLGHGGPKGLAQERILMREDLESWRNIDKLPLLITATCSFTGFDNPKEVSAGEAAILNPSGGAIASFSTVRAVYASSNQQLTSAIFDSLFVKINNRTQTIGDIFIEAKNRSQTGDNGQKFGLFGDPSLHLALPQYDITTTSINGKAANTTKTDTVRALQKVTIEGTVVDNNGTILNDFNGTIFPTVYDKAAKLKTLGQAAGSFTQEFTVQRNVLFKGAASVKSGRWQFSFVVPKDIDYEFGAGKISYYASDAVNRDAAGNFENFTIGGSTPSLSDNQAPKIEVFMNTFDWKSGGTTTANPTLLIRLSDDNGINVAGTSIGHDLTALLNDSKTAIVLNNFYEATKDDPTKGSVKYPLSNLAEGSYTLKIKAWDIANNVGEGSTEFIVATTAKGALDKVLTYPNPFSTKTNIQFEHNLNGTGFTAQIDIFNLAGQLLKTINQPVSPNGNLVSGIEWQPEGNLASGIYVFKVTLSARDGKGKIQTAESRFERLVLIK
ncbi:MAG: type IX secretion system sortase PorU [Saprospiraceae bacterium]|nr:type IX secretion system sortase PorU [Saprospiraceae bacterium]